jgi:hypothetical protein
MSTSFDILVIALGVLLGIFLLLSIIALVFVLRFIATLRRIAAKGELVIDSAEAAAEMFKKASGPLGVLRTVSSILETVNQHKHRKD